jgi:hypothetical protein
MAVSIVRGPNGKQHEVQHPDGIPSSQIIKYAQRQIASAASAEDGFIVDVGKGLFAGTSQAALSSAAGITQWVGQAYGSESLLTAAEDMRMYGQGIADDIGLDEDFRQSFFGQVVQGIGQLPVTIGAGAVGFAAAGPVGAFGAAAITTGGQMSSEFLGDMEQTLGKGYTEFNPEEKSKALTGMLAQTALGTTLEMAAIGKAVRPLLKGLKGTGVTSKVLRKAIAKDKSALREITESMIAEGGTEALQGQSLDTLASLLYDEDRELITLDTLKRRTMEFGVGSVVGGVVSGGVQVIGTPGKTSTTAKDLNKPAQERAELTIPDSVTVTYKPIDGPVKTVSLAVDAGQDPMAAVERDLAGRYDPTYPIEINEVSSPVPVGPEQELDLPDQAPDPTQEQVPVQPEAAVGEGIGPYDDSELTEPNSITGNVKTLNEIFDLGKKSWENTSGDPRRAQGTSDTIGKNFGEKAKEAHMRGWKSSMEAELKERQARKAPTPEQAPEPELSNIQARAKQAGMSEEQFRNEFPDVVNQLEKRQQAPAQQQAPAPATRTFSLPDPLKKGKPGYAQTQNITFASDLERATYSATTATQSDPAIRKRQQYRNLLKESGYSDTEINTMGREVRDQMKGQYKGKGSPIFVSLKQDVTAEASATYIPKRFVGDQAGKAPPFFQSFSPEQYDEGRFVDLETKQDLSNKTFEGGSIRIEGGRPILETSDNASETIINSKASEEGPLVRTNLFKQKAGWTWTKAPEGAPSTIVSVEQGPNHYYTLDFSSAKPLTLKTYPSKKSEPRGRPTTRGKVKLGNPVGEISIRGKKHTVYDRVTVGEPDVVAEAAPFVSPQKSELSHVEQKDIIDMNALIDDIVENDIPVWFWYADQLGEGDFSLPSGGTINLDAGPGYALQPANKAAGRVWASGKSAKEINNKISKLKYTDKNGKEQTGYIFLVSGSPDTMFLFNKQAFLTFYQNAFQEKKKDGTFKLREFSDVKKEILASRPTKIVKEALNEHSSLKSLLDSSSSRPFIEALLAQRSKSTPLAEYLKSKGFFDIENSQLRDGFYRDNNFKLNDILLVVQPTYADNKNPNHGTYSTPVYGKVIGVPDRAMDAYLLIPDSVRKANSITMEPPMAAQVIAPYGARITTIQKIVGSQQAKRSVSKLRKVIQDSPAGFTVDTGGEFATGGYIVAPDKSTERVIEQDKFNEESLTQYIVDNSANLNVEGAMLGGWYNSESGQYVLDVVFAVDNEQDAVEIAIWADQNAIFNLDTLTEIRTKDDNKNPKTPQGDTRTASEILSGKPTQNLSEYSSQRRRDSRGVRRTVPGQASPDVTAQAGDTAVEDRGPQDTYANGSQVMDAIEKDFDPIANKIGIAIRPAMGTNYVARYNATQQVIEYNPMLLLKRSKEGIRAAMREEIIHAAMHEVLMQKQRKTGRGRNPGDVWVEFFETFAKTLTDQERVDIGEVYTTLTTYHALGAEYSRAVVQNLLYGEFSEQYVMESQGGPAWNLIVDLLRSVQAYMAKVLGPMRKTNPEAAQVIVDTVELLKAADPSIRPKSQDVVADAYNETDKNTAKENTEAGERVSQDSSERIREQRKWFDGAFRETASKYLTPVITRLNRINPMFGRILQNLDTAIRTKSFKYRKQTEAFFNALNSIKGPEFLELKQLLFFSPTTEEANLPSNKLKSQRRDALLHKHGLLNMYRLDVEPILAQIYAEYSALGMPQIGYLEQYFPRVIKDLKGLINSYGHKAKRTFELLVNEENLRRSEIKDSEGLPAPLPAMQDSELARFFQEFLQGKFRLDINGVRLPGNVKVREISLIPPDKLKYYDNPGIAFGKYTNNMTRAIESFKVVGDTRKGRLQGTLGELTQELFVSGQIDQADAYEVKSLTELVTTQFAAESEILKSLGTLTYMATLINPGPVLVQIMDLYKVALYRGLRGVVSGTYRTVTGNRRFDIEEHFGIVKTQLSAEFEDPSVLQKALDFGLSRLVPFRQMDTAMKHASIEAAYDDFVRKAKAPVGSKKYNQILSELTITMGRKDALETIRDLQADKAMDSTLVKEALLAELLQRQPLTYLQVPEGYQTDPNKRLFYKLSTFMLLDLNYNRQEFMNDLGGPGKTLQQRTAALRRLTYMATLLTMFGLPSDLLDDWIAGKDTYIPEHVMNNMLGMFGLSRYTSTQVLEKGLVEGAVQRFTPPAINILMEGESSIRSWVKGDKELFEMKAWKFSPLSDVWYYKSGAGAESQKKWRKENLKEGVRPDIRRS